MEYSIQLEHPKKSTALFAALALPLSLRAEWQPEGRERSRVKICREETGTNSEKIDVKGTRYSVTSIVLSEGAKAVVMINLFFVTPWPRENMAERPSSRCYKCYILHIWILIGTGGGFWVV